MYRFVTFLLYLLRYQALDEEYLKVDAQFGGIDQRKIFTLAEKVKSIFKLLFLSDRILIGN